jgi:hypothetical protein
LRSTAGESVLEIVILIRTSADAKPAEVAELEHLLAGDFERNSLSAVNLADRTNPVSCRQWHVTRDCERCSRCTCRRRTLCEEPERICFRTVSREHPGKFTQFRTARWLDRFAHEAVGPQDDRPRSHGVNVSSRLLEAPGNFDLELDFFVIRGATAMQSGD